MKLLVNRLASQKYRKIVKFKRKLKAINRLSEINNFIKQSSNARSNESNNGGSEYSEHSEKDSDSTECNDECHNEESSETEDGEETVTDPHNPLEEKRNDSEPDSGDHSDSDIYFNNNSDKSDDSVDSDSDMDIEVQHQNQNEISAKLRSWAVECRVPHSTLDSLLNILNPVLPNLLKSSKTHLRTNRSHYRVTKMLASNETEGQYAYFGIKQGLHTCINLDLHYADILYLLINVHGNYLNQV